MHTSSEQVGWVHRAAWPWPRTVLARPRDEGRPPPGQPKASASDRHTQRSSASRPQDREARWGAFPVLWFGHAYGWPRRRAVTISTVLSSDKQE